MADQNLIQTHQTNASRLTDRFTHPLMSARRRFLAADSDKTWLFSIRNQLVLFMLAMIALGYGVASLSVSSTVDYSVRQKTADLLDEAEGARTEINLVLQRGYSDVLRYILDQNNAASSEQCNLLSAGDKIPIDADFNAATVLGIYQSDPLCKENFWCQFHFSRQWPVDATPRWSVIYWEPSDASADTRQQSGSRRHDRAYINLLVPIDGERYCLVQLEVTRLLQDKTRTARVISLIANVPKSFSGSQASMESVGDLALAPSGSPLASGEAPEANCGATNSESLFTLTRQHIQDAIRQLHSRQSSDTSRDLGILYRAESGKEALIPSHELIPRIAAGGNALFYSRAKVANADIFKTKSLGKDVRAEFERRLKSFEDYVRDKVDPYAFIYPVSDQFGEFRLRASTASSLALLKECVSNEIAILNDLPAASPKKPRQFDASLSWEDTELNNLVLAVQELSYRFTGAADGAHGPVQERDMTNAPQVIGYLIRAASMDEMRQSASEGVTFLRWASIIAGALAVGLTLIVATFLTSPLAHMKTVARKVSQIDFTSNEKDERKIQQLLDSLPVGRMDEVGTLSEQFCRTTREVIAANKRLREQSSEMLAEQRRAEQTEREKAIANEVGQARMQLLASVSHDMRQPLLPIFYHAERLLKRHNLPPDQQRLIGIILRNAHELNFLIEDILDYKRILAGDVVIDVQDVDLDQLMQEMLEQHAEATEARGTRLVKKNMWQGTLKTDKMRLKRVLNNLISNACKATTNGEIVIQASPMGADHVEISVTDNGVGMSEFQQKLVFQTAERRAELERQHNIRARKDSNSTGLGLYICKQLVLAMGGDIRFVSEEGKGTRFVVKLPVTPPQTPKKLRTIASAQAPTKLPTRQVKPGPSPRAIVVDDDPRSTAILAELLSGLGYEVEQLHDGDSALKKIAESKPQLVTLDVIMPDVDGWEVLQKLKAASVTADIPVIMVTVHPDEEKASLLGASGFVSKPVNEHEFSSAVRQAIGDRSGASVLIVDDDPECRRQLIELLEPLECKVLEAIDGEDALQRIDELESESLDLAIVDLYMPNMDGFALVEKLGHCPETRHTPIIVLSAGLLSESERRALLPRVDQFFSKGSVDIATLQQDIERLLTQHAVEQQQAS